MKGSSAVMAGLFVRLSPARAFALDSTHVSVLQVDALSVTDSPFGAVGDGVANDREAFQKAIVAAIKQKRPLLVPQPPNFYRIDLDIEHTHLLINGAVQIIGGGRTTTLIRFSLPNPDPSLAYAGFFIENGSKVQFSDLRLEEDVKAQEYDYEAFSCPSGPRKHTVNIERMDVDGFTSIVTSPSGGSADNSGELFITIRDCDFKPDLRFCVALWTVPFGHKRLHVYDSNFHDNKIGHLVYSHPQNSVLMENCRLDGAADWAVHFQGSEVAGDPEYQRFIGCWFGPNNDRGIISQRKDDVHAHVEVRNCVFEGRPAIQIRSDIDIDGCYFTTPLNPTSTVETFIGAYGSPPWKALITNCIFAPRSNSNPAIDLRQENIDVTIENCQFYNQFAGGMVAMGGSDQNKYTITNCLFYTRPIDSAQSIGLDVTDGQISVSRCRFVGRTTADRGVLFFPATETGPGAASRFQIDDSMFNNISGGSLFHVSGAASGTWSEKILGSNNRITNLITSKPLLTVEPEGISVFGYLAPVVGRAPAPLTAGPTLVINSNFDQYDVFGSADVTFIHWWYADGLSDPLFSGVVTFSAASGLTLVAGGNINLGGASSQVIAAGTDVRLFYEPSEDTWTVVAN